MIWRVRAAVAEAIEPQDDGCRKLLSAPENLRGLTMPFEAARGKAVVAPGATGLLVKRVDALPEKDEISEANATAVLLLAGPLASRPGAKKD